MNAHASRSDMLLLVIVAYQNSHRGRLPTSGIIWKICQNLIRETNGEAFSAYQSPYARRSDIAPWTFERDIVELIQTRQIRFDGDRRLAPTETGYRSIRTPAALPFFPLLEELARHAPEE